jgi:hypothetical protein
MVEEKPYGFSIDKIGTRIPDPVLKNRLNPAAGGGAGHENQTRVPLKQLKSSSGYENHWARFPPGSNSLVKKQPTIQFRV